MSFEIKDLKLQNAMDFANFTPINFPGSAAGGVLLAANNLSDVSSTATARNNLMGVTVTATGQSIAAVPPGPALSFLQYIGSNVATFRSTAGVLSDIGAQASASNLTSLSSGAAPGTVGRATLALGTNTGKKYIQISDNIVSMVAPSVLATDTLNGLSIDASTGHLRVDSTAYFGDFNCTGANVSITGNVSINGPFTVSGGNLITLQSSGASNITLPTGTFTLATLTGSETLTNKVLSASTISGGTAVGITTLGVRSTGAPFDFQIGNADVFTQARKLSVVMGDANRTLNLTGGHFTTSGGAITLTATADSNVTLPTTGTLSTLVGSETLANKTLTSPVISTITGCTTIAGGPLVIGPNYLYLQATDITIGQAYGGGGFPNATDVWFWANHFYFGAHQDHTIGSAPGSVLAWFARADGSNSDALFSSWTSHPIVELHRSIGTPGANTPVQSGNNLGELRFTGCNATTGVNTTRTIGSKILVTAAETFSSTNKGTSVAIQTVLAGASLSLANRFIIDGTGLVTIGSGGTGGLAIAGTAGNGFLELLTQSSPPAAPVSGYRDYADSSGRKSWIRQSDGFTRTFDSTLTANRVFSLPDMTGTLDIGLNNSATSAQTPNASTRTYIIGSKITVPSNKLQIGTSFSWKFNMTKTAAGTATSLIDIAVGTLGTTGDTAVASFTKPAGTAAADEGFVTIEAVMRGPLSASAVISGTFTMMHNGNTVGHMTIPIAVVNSLSSTFDATTANLFVGLCITTGASDAITIQQVSTHAANI